MASTEQWQQVHAALDALDGDALASLWHQLASDIYAKCQRLEWDRDKRTLTCPVCDAVFDLSMKGEPTLPQLHIVEFGVDRALVVGESDGDVLVSYYDQCHPDMEILHLECGDCEVALRLPDGLSLDYLT